jgi:CHAD domain-containing protein
MPGDGELLSAFFREQYARMVAHDAGVRSGEDPEDLHQLRVAVRRLRSILKSTKAALERERAESLQDGLSWLAGETGRARDLDVMLPALDADLVSLQPEDREAVEPIVRKLEEARTVAAAQAQEAVAGDRYRLLLREIENAPEAVSPNGDAALEKAARKEFKRLRKVMKDVVESPTDEAIHRARIKGKRARYATELLEAELGRPGAELISATKRFQDVAGEHQDAVVAEAELRAAARGLRAQRTLLAAGILLAAQQERRRVAADELPAAWKRVDKAAAKVWD